MENAKLVKDSLGNIIVKQNFDNAGYVMLYDNFQGKILQSLNNMIVTTDAFSKFRIIS